MWQTKIFSVNNSRYYTNIRYMEKEDGKHWIVFKDILKALGYAPSSIGSGIKSLAKTIPSQYTQTEYTSYTSIDSKMTAVIVVDYGGCVCFLARTRMGKPAILKAWLESAIFTQEEISVPVEIPEPAKPQKKTDANTSRATATWKFDGYSIRMLLLENKMYFYAVDIAKVFGEVNHRSITIKFIQKDQCSTVYYGQRPATILTIEGVVTMLDHVTDTNKVAIFKDWLLKTAIPNYQKGKTISDYYSPQPKEDKTQQKNKPANNSIMLAFEESIPVTKTLTYRVSDNPNSTEQTIDVVLKAETAYFDVRDLARIFQCTTDKLLEMIPNVWCSYQTIIGTVYYTDSNGQERQQKTKKIGLYTTDSGLRVLLEKTDQTRFRDWILSSVFPELHTEGYIPEDPYDIDTNGLTEKEMKDSTNIYDKYRGIKTVDEEAGLFECVFNDTEIMILAGRQEIWFNLGSVEKALDYPLYIAQSQPLKAINFILVDASYVKKLNMNEDKKGSGWIPYCIEYEGLKAFLAECNKPNAEAFYLFLEEGVIPYIKKQANLKEGEKNMTNVKENRTAEPSVPEPSAEPEINIEKLLSDPDTFIRMLKAYKAVKDSKDDLSAENEALREYIRANKSKIDFADILASDVNSEEAKKFAKLLAESIIENGSQRLKAWLLDSIQPKKS